LACLLQQTQARHSTPHAAPELLLADDLARESAHTRHKQGTSDSWSRPARGVVLSSAMKGF